MSVKVLKPMGPKSFRPFVVHFDKALGPGNDISEIKPTGVFLHEGTDPDYATRLYGTPVANGQDVVAWQNRGLLGCVYRYEFLVKGADGRECDCTVLLPIHTI